MEALDDGPEKHVVKSFPLVRNAGIGVTAQFQCPRCAGDVGHAGQVTLDNVPDPIWEQCEVKVLTGLWCSMALNPYLCSCH